MSAWKPNATPSSTLSMLAGDQRWRPPTARGRPAKPRHLRLWPLSSLAREAGSSATPHEYHLH
jgi:hypothetical protein